MTTDADGRVRMEFVLPVRGLIGYRGQLLTDTRGTALLHQIGEGYGPWAGEVTHRTNGVLVADRAGISNAYGLFNLEQRAELFIGAGVEVYEGMIVGENSRSGDMDVNPTKEKKLTNIRTHSHDESLRLTPPRPITLEIGDRVHRGRRARRGDPAVDPAAQARARPQHDRRRERGPGRGPAARGRARGDGRRLTVAAPAELGVPAGAARPGAGGAHIRGGWAPRRSTGTHEPAAPPGRSIRSGRRTPRRRIVRTRSVRSARDARRSAPGPRLVALLDAAWPAERSIGRHEQGGHHVDRPGPSWSRRTG